MVKAKAPKVTYKQEGGDDGYCYVVRVDGNPYVSGCTRGEAQAYKRRILSDWEAKQQPKAPAKVRPMSAGQVSALLEKLRGPMMRTFSVTAGDLEEACRSCGEELDNAAAVESCFDGGGLMGMYGGVEGKEAEALLDEVTKAGHYDQVFKAAVRQIRLV